MIKAKWTMDPEEHAEWEAWVEARPPHIQEVARRLPGDRLYKNTKTGQVCVIYSYDEPITGGVTLKVYNIPECNGPATGDLVVFGIDPEDLEPATQEYIDACEAKWSGVNDIFGGVT